MVRLRPTTMTLDPYSNTQVPNWAGVLSELPLETLAPAEPRLSEEPIQEARNAVTSGWTLYLDKTADVTEHDRMRVRGEEYDVLGEPASWSGEGLVVQVEHTAG